MNNYIIAMGEKGVLSNRQMEALLCTAEGLTSKETASVMGITERTANAHTEDGMCKVGAINRPHFIAIAFSKGMIRSTAAGYALWKFTIVLIFQMMVGIALAPSILNSDGSFMRPGRRPQSSRVTKTGRRETSMPLFSVQ